jgi:hypothetical protein
LVDQYRVHDTTHLDELLPITTIASEARDFPRRDRTDLAETHLGHHPLEAGTVHSTGGRTTKIVVDHFDLAPAKLTQSLPHGILQ